MAATKKATVKKTSKKETIPSNKVVLEQSALFEDEASAPVKDAPVVNPIVTKSKSSMTPFSVLGLAFTDYEAFKKIPDDILRGFYFIINNQMSVQFPLQADCMNLNKISEAQVVRYWADFLRARFNKLPSFIFTKGKQKSEESRKEVVKYTDKVLMDFAVANDCSVKEVRFALRQRPVQMGQELDEFIERQELIERLRTEKVEALKVKKNEM